MKILNLFSRKIYVRSFVLLLFSMHFTTACSELIKPCDTIENRSGATGTRPYIFTQTHQDNAPWWRKNMGQGESAWKPQSIPVYSCIQIQLPGNPTQWKLKRITLDANNIRVENAAPLIINNPNRYIHQCEKEKIKSSECPDKIYQFEFNVTQPGTIKITLEGNPGAKIPVSLAKKETGFNQFNLTLKITK